MSETAVGQGQKDIFLLDSAVRTHCIVCNCWSIQDTRGRSCSPHALRALDEKKEGRLTQGNEIVPPVSSHKVFKCFQCHLSRSSCASSVISRGLHVLLVSSRGLLSASRHVFLRGPVARQTRSRADTSTAIVEAGIAPRTVAPNWGCVSSLFPPRRRDFVSLHHTTWHVSDSRPGYSVTTTTLIQICIKRWGVQINCITSFFKMMWSVSIFVVVHVRTYPLRGKRCKVAESTLKWLAFVCVFLLDEVIVSTRRLESDP